MTDTLQTRTILLIEDEEEQYSILVKAFAERGYAMVVATRAEEALRLIEQVLPELLIVDIKLEGMDGITFFEHCKSLGLIGRIPFIYLTAYNSLSMAMEAKKQGAAEYIVKPYDLDFLLDTVDEIFARKQAGNIP